MALSQQEINKLQLTPQGYRSPEGKLYEQNVLGYQEIGAAPQAIIPNIQQQSQPRDTSVTTGQINPNPINYAPQSGPIPAAQAGPQTPIDLGTPKAGIDNASPLVAGGLQLSKGLASDAKTPEQAKATAAQMRLVDLIGQTGGQAQELAAQEQAQGLEQKRQAYQDLSNQIQVKNAEYKQLQDQFGMLTATNEGKPITMNSIIGAQAQINRVQQATLNSKASEIGMITAQAQAMQGNIELAQETAKRAVDLKFANKFEEIAILQSQLKVLEPTLNAQEKARAEQLKLQYEQERNEAAVSLANDKDKNSTLLNLMQTYNDAGISLNDTIESANAKIVTNSKIYREKVRPPANAGGGAISPTAGSLLNEAEQRKQELISLTNELLNPNAVGKKAAVGASIQKVLFGAQSLGLQPGRSAFEAKVNTLKSNLTLGNLKLLKGAMSDKDLLFLMSVGSSLDTNMSEKEFDKELTRVKEKISGIPSPVSNLPTTQNRPPLNSFNFKK